MINIRKVIEFVENLVRVVDSIKRILYFSKDIGDYRSRIFKTLFYRNSKQSIVWLA